MPVVFFLTDPATTEIYTLSLHDALPIFTLSGLAMLLWGLHRLGRLGPDPPRVGDRKSTRLNSSHSQISYAVFCLKKKKLQALPLELFGLLVGRVSTPERPAAVMRLAQAQ